MPDSTEHNGMTRVEGTILRVGADYPPTASTTDSAHRTVHVRVRAVELKEANAFVALRHRHHKPTVSHRFSLGAFVERSVEDAWCAETSQDGTFDPSNPARGQCAVTALVVQDQFGGDILRATVGGASHYINAVNGAIVDLTKSQFGDGAEYDAPPVPRPREYLLSSPDTARRYAALRRRVGFTMVGACIVGRPVARNTNQRTCVEVSRLVTDGTYNACSALYAAAARAAKALGYERIQTFILETESGTSLKASGWVNEGPAGGGTWERPNLHAKEGLLWSNHRDDQPICGKTKWAKMLNDKMEIADA